MGKKKSKKKTKSQDKSKPKQVVTGTVGLELKEVLDDAQSSFDATPPENVVNKPEIDETDRTEFSVDASPEDVSKYVKDLRKYIRIFKATQQKYEELKSKLENDKKLWEEDKAREESKLKENKECAEAEVEKQKQELAEKREELNNRELKLIEDEDASKVGDHSGVIERLINSFRENKERIIDGAETYFKEQEEMTNEYLQKLNSVLAKKAQLDTKAKEISIREKKIKDIEALWEEDRASMRKEIEEEFKEENEDKIEHLSTEVERYKAKLDKANKETDRFRNQLDKIRAAFGDSDPSEMATTCSKQKEEIDNLREELNSRPLQEDLNNKQKEIELLEHELNELNGKLNEQEYYQLKAMFDNNDVLIRDKQLLVDKIESAKAREKNLRDTIDDLRRTISEINETHNKGNAFKASCKYDQGDYQIPLEIIKNSVPSCLSEFVCYLQSYMASPKNGDKELKYSKDTIKKFIAGLHMSPITILQGISGTGKTSLPRAVAMAMIAYDSRYDLENGEDELPKAAYRICPIQSGWRDKMDLMGFYNSFEKSYHETEFFNALYLANQPKYKDCLFFIVPDEMNLSRPEHYFADFLSKLEQPEDQRKVKIDNIPEDICPKSIIGGTLSIPKNVRFIGTANHDETTLEFAPKTYDRSNVIDMPRNCPTDKIPDFTERYNVTYNWLEEQFKKAEENHGKECEKFDNFLKDEQLIEILAKRGIGVGNRFEGQARRFLSVFVEAGDNVEEDTSKAADHLMTTRLLRTLKDNYDLSYDTLDEFKEQYKTVFAKHFDQEPKEAIELIEKELEKKK